MSLVIRLPPLVMPVERSIEPAHSARHALWLRTLLVGHLRDSALIAIVERVWSVLCSHPWLYDLHPLDDAGIRSIAGVLAPPPPPGPEHDLQRRAGLTHGAYISGDPPRRPCGVFAVACLCLRFGLDDLGARLARWTVRTAPQDALRDTLSWDVLSFCLAACSLDSVTFYACLARLDGVFGTDALGWLDRYDFPRPDDARAQALVQSDRLAHCLDSAPPSAWEQRET